MRVDGEDAKIHNAVRLDDFMNANQGELISADEQTGEVTYKDASGTPKTVTLGPHAIRILRKLR